MSYLSPQLNNVNEITHILLSIGHMAIKYHLLLQSLLFFRIISISSLLLLDILSTIF